MHLSVSVEEALLRLVLALVFGGLLGFEREWKDKPAGLRTHIMVAFGATCFTLVGLELYATLQTGESGGSAGDPMRVVQGITGGIGFLGAGAIITHKGTVEGLTTAAAIWLTGAIGVACGVGLYWIASLATIFGLATLYGLARFEDALHERLGTDSAESAGHGHSKPADK